MSEVQAQIHDRLVERLWESERRYRSLVENLRDPVIQCTPSGELTYVSPAWRELTGHDFESSRGRSILEFVRPGDRDALAGALSRAGEFDESPQIQGEVALMTRDGTTVNVGYSLGRGLRDSLVGSLHDLSSRKEAEDSLARARDAAEEASRLKSSFLANMSHEIRTPLSAVLGFTELLAQETLDADERHEYADRVQRQGRHLLALVNDILDLSRMESGHLEVTADSVDLPELVDDLKRQHMGAARDKGLCLETVWTGRLPPGQLLQTDPTRVRQVLTNLVSNAVKFTERGSVGLEVAVDPVGRILRFVVTDTGIGIEPHMVPVIFEPFTQADKTIARRFGGAGLGLAISAGLAELLGGSLTCVSEPGRGSSFTLTLPLSWVERPEHTITAEPAGIREVPSMRGEACSVLVVEDTSDLQKMMVRFCESVGWKAWAASNGAEVLERVSAAATPFQVILMDMQMPVLDGYEATRRLRRNGYTGVIVALTAHAMRGDREKCLEAGCDDYLAKPVTREVLRDLLERRRVPAVCPTPGAGPGSSGQARDL